MFGLSFESLGFESAIVQVKLSRRRAIAKLITAATSHSLHGHFP